MAAIAAALSIAIVVKAHPGFARIGPILAIKGVSAPADWQQEITTDSDRHEVCQL
jgi:hypothetical protein